MKIAGFIKFYNEESKGNLERALKCLSSICDVIVAADDGSTDNSIKIAEKYTEHIIRFNEPNLPKELERKQEMLEYTLQLDPDWILWIDGDEILEAKAERGIKDLCKFGDSFGIDGFAFHEINLWRSECWYRLDNKYNDLWKINLWKNNGNLKFDISPGLHKQQHPLGINKVFATNIQLIHYGFSSEKLIVDKYLMYKKLGQKGWALDRLIDERTLQLSPVNLAWFPEYAKPKIVPKPQALRREEWLKLAGEEDGDTTKREDFVSNNDNKESTKSS